MGSAVCACFPHFPEWRAWNWEAVPRHGSAGVALALCFATGSTCFVVALSFTTVANILLIQAGVPLIAALLGWVLFQEKVAPETWIAIGAVRHAELMKPS
jgi:drug/metabolite transporter (DMT)-like permease